MTSLGVSHGVYTGFVLIGVDAVFHTASELVVPPRKPGRTTSRM